jgi:hypothetical protein
LSSHDLFSLHSSVDSALVLRLSVCLPWHVFTVIQKLTGARGVSHSTPHRNGAGLLLTRLDLKTRYRDDLSGQVTNPSHVTGHIENRRLQIRVLNDFPGKLLAPKGGGRAPWHPPIFANRCCTQSDGRQRHLLLHTAWRPTPRGQACGSGAARADSPALDKQTDKRTSRRTSGQADGQADK